MASGAGTCPPGVTWSTACGSASAKTAHNFSGVVPAWVDQALICSGENTLPIWSAETGWFSPVETHDCTLLPSPAASKRETTEETNESTSSWPWSPSRGLEKIACAVR